MKWLEFLQGKKTYIIMIVGFVFNLGCLAGWWIESSTVWGFVNGLLGFLGIGAIKSAIVKSTK